MDSNLYISKARLTLKAKRSIILNSRLIGRNRQTRQIRNRQGSLFGKCVRLDIIGFMPEWRNGRRGGLKIRCPQGRVGSSPSSGI